MEYQLKNILLTIKTEKREILVIKQLRECLTDEIQVISCLPEEEQFLQNKSLVIADDKEAAQAWRKNGFFVLYYFHENNKHEELDDFPYLIEGFEDVSNQYFERIFRRFKEIPWDILETKRCLLRETTVEDVCEFYRIYQEPSITEYMENLFEDSDEEKAYTESYIQNMYRFTEFGIWTVQEKATGEIIGRAGLDLREGYDAPELGFVIEKKHQNLGIAYEVCSGILQYAREQLELERIFSFVKKGNVASVNLLKKLGFFEHGEVILENELHDCFIINLAERE